MSIKKQDPIWTKSFVGISMTQLMVFIIFYVLITTLPSYVINELGGTVADGGLIVTTMLISAVLIRTVSATLLEKIGKKRGLVISVIAFAVTTLFYIWVESFIPLLILRCIHGLTFGAVTTATGAIAADVVPANRRGEGIGYFALASNLAVVIGPFIGLTLLQFVSFQTLFIVLSIMMSVGVLFAVSVRVPPQEKPVLAVSSERKLSIYDFVEQKALPVAFICSISAIAYSSIISFISLYSESIGLAEVASYFFLVYAATMLISRPFLGKRFDRRGPNSVIIPCLFIFVAGFILLSFTVNAWMLLLSAVLMGLGFGTIVPSFQTMAIQAAHPSRSGHATATFFTLFDTGIALGSFVCGLIVTSFGFQNMYIICSVIVLIVLALYMSFQAKQKKQAYNLDLEKTYQNTR